METMEDFINFYEHKVSLRSVVKKDGIPVLKASDESHWPTVAGSEADLIVPNTDDRRETVAIEVLV